MILEIIPRKNCWLQNEQGNSMFSLLQNSMHVLMVYTLLASQYTFEHCQNNKGRLDSCILRNREDTLNMRLLGIWKRETGCPPVRKWQPEHRAREVCGALLHRRVWRKMLFWSQKYANTDKNEQNPEVFEHLWNQNSSSVKWNTNNNNHWLRIF